MGEASAVSLLEELRADQPTGVGCSVCTFLETRPEPEQAEWAEAMKDRTISNSTIHRALRKRGFTLTPSPVRSHRNHDPR